MFFKVAIAIGAGLASALLFFIPVKGTTIAMLLAFAGPLPIMLAGLGFGAGVGFGAAAIGTLAISAALHPLLGLFFAISLGLPSFWLARLAARSEEVTDPQTGEIGHVPALSSGHLLAWVATIAAATALLPIIVMAARGESLAANIDDVAQQLAPIIGRLFNGEANLPYGLSAGDFARALVLAMPALVAAWGVITLALNLWVAGRIARISGLIPARDLDLPYRLSLPRDCLWVLGASIVACMLGETPRFIASTMTASFLMAYALHGLAVMHGFLRGNPLRGALLFGLYALIVLTAWPLLLAAAVGLFDSLIPLTRRPLPTATAA